MSVTSGSPGRPDDPDRERRLDWARLLARTFGVDALLCPRCSPRGRPGWRGQQELPLEPKAEAELLDPPFHDDPA